MSSAAIPDAPAACRSRAKMLPTSPKPMIAKVVMLLPVLCIEVGRRRALRIRGEITTSILRFVPSHGLISLLPWELTASVADLETAAVNSPRILTGAQSDFSNWVQQAPHRSSGPCNALVGGRDLGF